MEDVKNTLNEALYVLAKIRLAQVGLEKTLKKFEVRLEELEKLSHKHWWQRNGH